MAGISTKILRGTKAWEATRNLPNAVIGRVVETSDVIKAVKVKVEDLKFDNFLNMVSAFDNLGSVSFIIGFQIKSRMLSLTG